jgi:ATP-dependent Clp protease protease subunit
MKNKLIVFLSVILGLTLLVTNLSGSDKIPEDMVVLTKDNTIVLNEVVSSESVAKVIHKAKELNALAKKGRTRPVYLFLNTPGGSVQSGLELIEALHGLECPVNTVTLFSASMGFQIVQNLGERLILKNGVLMSHRAKGGFEGEFGGQSPSQIESRYAIWKSRLDELDQQTVDRTKGKQTLASYQKQYSSEMWLTGTQSVSQGYADKVVRVRCDPSLSGTTEHTAQLLFLSVTYELDNCPINTGPLNVRVDFVTNKGRNMDLKTFTEAGGEFGPNCLTESATNKNKVCALDTSLNIDKIHDATSKFSEGFDNNKNKIVPMY